MDLYCWIALVLGQNVSVYTESVCLHTKICTDSMHRALNLRSLMLGTVLGMYFKLWYSYTLQSSIVFLVHFILMPSDRGSLLSWFLMSTKLY